MDLRREAALKRLPSPGNWRNLGRVTPVHGESEDRGNVPLGQRRPHGLNRMGQRLVRPAVESLRLVWYGWHVQTRHCIDLYELSGMVVKPEVFRSLPHRPLFVHRV